EAEAEAERLRAEEEAAAAIPAEKELPDLPPLDGSATPLQPVEEPSGLNIPVILAASGGVIGLCAAAFVFIL
ncbi:MAG: hypothetical protein ACJZ40_00395, partial [Candidatus Poseidoniaceae archaeon]